MVKVFLAVLGIVLTAGIFTAAAKSAGFKLRRGNFRVFGRPSRWIPVAAALLAVWLGVGLAMCKTGASPGVSGDLPGEAPVTPPPSATAAPSPSPAKTAGPPVSETPSPTPEPTETPIRPEILTAREEFGNDDVVGYLDVPGTAIQYYVTQAGDNDFYINHDIHKKASSAGWIFLDFENDFSRGDKNTIIYGHNMNAKIMFHDLRNFLSEDFSRNHHYLRLMTTHKEETYEVFAVFLTGTEFCYNLVYITDEQFGDILDTMNAKSIHDFGVEVTSGDRVLTLSTCSNLPDDSRLVVAGKYIGDGWLGADE